MDVRFKSKIEKLENKLNEKLGNTMREFTDQIKKPTKELKSMLGTFPKNFFTYDTLKKNTFLLNEVFKSVFGDSYKKINTIMRKNYYGKYPKIEFEVAKCEVYIGKKKIKATIDTGANFTIISAKLMRELDLPVNYNVKTTPNYGE